MVCYFKRICGINQAEDRVTWPDLLHRHTIALASFREWSVVSARLRIRAQPRNPCRARNSASAWTCLSPAPPSLHCTNWVQKIAPVIFCNTVFGLSTVFGQQTVHSLPKTRLGLVWYFPDMSGWTSGPIFSGGVRFFPDIDRGTSGGDFENYAEPKTQVFRCFWYHTHYKNYF